MIRIEAPRRPKRGIDMTPLVDCVFQLIIFFFLTATFARREGLTVELPGAKDARPSDPRALEVSIDESGLVRFEGRVIEPAALRAALESAARAKPEDTPLTIVADRRVALDAVAGVLDAARSAGLRAACLATRDARARPQGGEDSATVESRGTPAGSTDADSPSRGGTAP